MSIIKKIFFISFTLVNLGFSYNTINWQTTRNGSSSGSCGLSSSKISITIHPYYADVVEEAEISTSGNIWSGDSKTLEITGTFNLSPGTALRSLLLWNGNTILKAKLKSRTDADSAYENIVNRVVVKDPAIIHYLGNNQYQFKIFPVELNNSRKIRILYTVPLQMSADGPQFKITNAFFAYNLSQTPNQIPVEIKSSTTGSCIIQHGMTKKTIQFGAVYSIPASDFREYTTNGYLTGNSKPIFITPIVKTWNTAYCYSIDSGDVKGHYAAVFASIPDTITAFIKEKDLEINSLTVEAKITAGSKFFLSDMPDKKFCMAFVKSSTPWDSTITWTCYDNATGLSVISSQQKLTCISDSVSSMIPFIWGAKYSLREGKGPLGALFGFVDSKMSLLALEEDTLPGNIALQYKEDGVPPLDPKEIIIKQSNKPIAPNENVIFESVIRQVIRTNSFHITFASGMLKVQFTNKFSGAFKLLIVDANGRVIQKIAGVNKSGSVFSYKIPKNLKGLFLIKLQAGNEYMQKKIILN